MPRRPPITDPTAPQQVTRSPVRVGAPGFVTPSGGGPEIETGPDIVGFLQSASQSLRVLLQDKIKDNQQRDAQAAADRVRTLITNSEETLAGLEKLAGQPLDKINPKEANQLLKDFSDQFDEVNQAQMAGVLNEYGRQDAKRAAGKLAPLIKDLVSPDIPDALEQFNAAAQRVLSEETNAKLAGPFPEEYLSQIQYTFEESRQELENQLRGLRKRAVSDATLQRNRSVLDEGSGALRGLGLALRTPELAEGILKKDLPQILEHHIVPFSGESPGKALEDTLVGYIKFVQFSKEDDEDKLAFLDRFAEFATLPDGRLAAQKGGIVAVAQQLETSRRQIEDQQDTRSERRRKQLRDARNSVELHVADEVAGLLEVNPDATAADIEAAAKARVTELREGEATAAEDRTLANTLDPDGLARATRLGILRALSEETQLNRAERSAALDLTLRTLAEQGPEAAREIAQGLPPQSDEGKKALEAITGDPASTVLAQPSSPLNRIKDDVTNLLKVARELPAAQRQQAVKLSQMVAEFEANFARQDFETIEEANNALAQATRSLSQAVTEAEAATFETEAGVEAEYLDALTKIEHGDVAGARTLTAGKSYGAERDLKLANRFRDVEGQQARVLAFVQTSTQDSEILRNLGGLTGFNELDPDEQNRRILNTQQKARGVLQEWATDLIASGVREEQIIPLLPDKRAQVLDEVIFSEYGEHPIPDPIAVADAAFRGHKNATASFVFGSIEERSTAVDGLITDPQTGLLRDTFGQLPVPRQHDNFGVKLEQALGSGAHEPLAQLKRDGTLRLLTSVGPLEQEGWYRMLATIPGSLGPAGQNFRLLAPLGDSVDDSLERIQDLPAAGFLTKDDVASLAEQVESLRLPIPFTGAQAAQRIGKILFDPEFKAVNLSNGGQAIISRRMDPTTLTESSIYIHLTLPVPEKMRGAPFTALHPGTEPTEMDPALLRRLLGVPEDDTAAARRLKVPVEDVQKTVLQMAGVAMRFAQKAAE